MVHGGVPVPVVPLALESVAVVTVVPTRKSVNVWISACMFIALGSSSMVLKCPFSRLFVNNTLRMVLLAFTWWPSS